MSLSEAFEVVISMSNLLSGLPNQLKFFWFLWLIATYWLVACTKTTLNNTEKSAPVSKIELNETYTSAPDQSYKQINKPSQSTVGNENLISQGDSNTIYKNSTVYNAPIIINPDALKRPDSELVRETHFQDEIWSKVNGISEEQLYTLLGKANHISSNLNTDTWVYKRLIKKPYTDALVDYHIRVDRKTKKVSGAQAINLIGH